MTRLTKNRLLLSALLLLTFGFPLVGFLVAWRDVHVRIERSAKDFVTRSAVPMLQRWDLDELLDNSTTAGADRLRGGEHGAILEKFGRLTQVEQVDLVTPHAKETEDQGMMYARAVIVGRAGAKGVTVVLDLRNVTADNEWEFDRIEYRTTQ